MSDEFVTMRQAMDLIGVSRITLMRRVGEGWLVPYVRESNRQRHWFKREDVLALDVPRPAGRPRKAVNAPQVSGEVAVSR